MLLKSTLRTIRSSIGRYLAILAIIALGVGFFAGLRVTEQSMIRTADHYVQELSLYDFRLVSTLGFTEEDVTAFRNLEGIQGAYGAYSADLIYVADGGSDAVLHAHSLTDGVNGLDLVAGRLPTAADECILDAKYASEEDIGKKIVLSEALPEENREAFTCGEYTVTGIANAVIYLNFERGITSLAGGKVSGFLYLLPEGFTSQVYTEIYLTLPPSGEIYSDAYDAAVDGIRGEIEALLDERAQIRYEALYKETKSQLDVARVKLNQLKAIMGEIPEILAAQEKLDAGYAALAEFSPATVYTLDRSSNTGYASLASDTAIVSGVAKVFPLFFFLVAALVCITTMTRMVGEQRTQNGILKALGYGDGAVLSQYLMYAGSASLLGCIIGFLAGSRLLPLALWKVYQIMYAVECPIAYVLDWGLFALCSALFLVCALGATFFVCFRELRENAASLTRPKAPGSGKKILLERFPPLWKRIKFLHKISIRNIVRYKKRMIMMILGIGGCTALLLTGFGIRDSIRPIVSYQYGEIELYDASVSFLTGLDAEGETAFLDQTKEVTEEVAFLYTENLIASLQEGEKEIFLVAYDTPPEGFIDLHDGDTSLAFPGEGEAVVDYRFAQAEGLSVGDTLTLRNGAYQTLTVTITGIFDNYIYDYVYIHLDTYRTQLGETPACNTAYVHLLPGENPHEAGAVLLSADQVARVSLTEEMATRVESMLGSLDYIVLIVLVCAGALAFIVLFNLTNITITERSRELATIKVLGFYSREQHSYIFRENLILTGVSCIVGIPLGIALLHYVMGQIKISTIYFGCRVSPLSYLFAVLITFAFTLLVNLTLTGKIQRINMAEALKAVE